MLDVGYELLKLMEANVQNISHISRTYRAHIAWGPDTYNFHRLLVFNGFSTALVTRLISIT